MLNTTTTSALHQTLGFGFFKAFDQSLSTISPYLIKTNPWLLVLNLFESEAVLEKQNFMQYTTSMAAGQKSNSLSTVSEKQPVVSSIQSVVYVSRSIKQFHFLKLERFNSLKHIIESRQHKNQPILPLFVFTNRIKKQFKRDFES